MYRATYVNWLAQTLLPLPFVVPNHKPPLTHSHRRQRQ